jgi:hypothetical protein
LSECVGSATAVGGADEGEGLEYGSERMQLSADAIADWHSDVRGRRGTKKMMGKQIRRWMKGRGTI